MTAGVGQAVSFLAYPPMSFILFLRWLPSAQDEVFCLMKTSREVSVGRRLMLRLEAILVTEGDELFFHLRG